MYSVNINTNYLTAYVFFVLVLSLDLPDYVGKIPTYNHVV